MILGLDISLSATGWALIEPSGHLLAMGTIKSKPNTDRFARFDKIRLWHVIYQVLHATT